MKRFFDSLYYHFYKMGLFIGNSDAPSSAVYCILCPSAAYLISFLGLLRLLNKEIISEQAIEVILIILYYFCAIMVLLIFNLNTSSLKIRQIGYNAF